MPGTAMVIFPGASAVIASRAGNATRTSARKLIALRVIGASLAREGLGVLPHRAIDELLVGNGSLPRLDAAQFLLGGDYGLEVVLAEAVVPGRPQLDADKERSEEHTSELQSLRHLVCRLLLEKKK